MKINNFNKRFLILLLAFFSAGSSLFAFENSPHLNSRDYDYLQADQNRKGFFLEELSFPNGLQVIHKNLFYPSGKFSETAEVDNALNNSVSLSPQVSVYLQNKRKILKNQIFPFHFFW